MNNLLKNNIISLFSLLFATSGYFIAHTINCDMKHIYQSGFTKYVLLFFIITYVIIDHSNNKINPILHILNSLIIFMLFIILQKFNHTYYVLVWFLLYLLIICYKYEEYYEEDMNKKELTIKIRNILLFILLMIYMGGTITYVYNYNYNKFNIINFLFVKECKK